VRVLSIHGNTSVGTASPLLARQQSARGEVKLREHVGETERIMWGWTDVLAGRRTAGKIEGTIKFGGVVPSKAFYRRCVGYVEQFGADFYPIPFYIPLRLSFRPIILVHPITRGPSLP
jgi:hypothetical protein